MSESLVRDVAGELIAGESLTVTVNGDCMLPHLHHGAKVSVEPARYYWPGDMLVVNSNRGLLVHRMIGVWRRRSEWRTFTQADNSNWPDAAHAPGAVIGRVTAVAGEGDIKPISLATRVAALGSFGRFLLRYALGQHPGELN